jgi:hypothetical protein
VLHREVPLLPLSTMLALFVRLRMSMKRSKFRFIGKKTKRLAVFQFPIDD